MTPTAPTRGLTGCSSFRDKITVGLVSVRSRPLLSLLYSYYSLSIPFSYFCKYSLVHLFSVQICFQALLSSPVPGEQVSLYPIPAITHTNRPQGIGAATAKAFAAAGCERVAITDLNEDSLQKTADAIRSTHPKVQLHIQAGNIADDHFADLFIEQVVRVFGRVDYAVNCAGVIGKSLRSAETSLEEFDRVNTINYRGCWLSSRAELRQMAAQDGLPSHDPSRPPQRGAVVNVASQLGIVSRPGAREY